METSQEYWKTRIFQSTSEKNIQLLYTSNFYSHGANMDFYRPNIMQITGNTNGNETVYDQYLIKRHEMKWMDWDYWENEDYWYYKGNTCKKCDCVGCIARSTNSLWNGKAISCMERKNILNGIKHMHDDIKE